jgi:uncharacterized protein YndB with AHSA1/START domain
VIQANDPARVATATPEAADEILTSRRIAAPRAIVFKAWTSPEHVDAWWGPNGFRTTTTEMRIAPGGVWNFTMHGPDGTDYPNQIVFTEVVDAERLVYDHGDGKPGSPPHFHVVVTFADDGDGTLLTMRARFPSAAARQYVAENFHAVEGGRQTLERLDAYVGARSRQANASWHPAG